MTTVLRKFAAAAAMIVATVMVGCTSLPGTPKGLTGPGEAGATGTASGGIGGKTAAPQASGGQAGAVFAATGGTNEGGASGSGSGGTEPSGGGSGGTKPAVGSGGVTGLGGIVASGGARGTGGTSGSGMGGGGTSDGGASAGGSGRGNGGRGPREGGGGATAGSSGASGASGTGTFIAVAELLGATCGNGTCHDGTAHVDLRNTAGLYGRIVGATPNGSMTMTACKLKTLVVPSDTANSVISNIVKAAVSGCSNARMPDECSTTSANPRACLSAAQINTIDSWIRAGAPM